MQGYLPRAAVLNITLIWCAGPLRPDIPGTLSVVVLIISVLAILSSANEPMFIRLDQSRVFHSPSLVVFEAIFVIRAKNAACLQVRT